MISENVEKPDISFHPASTIIQVSTIGSKIIPSSRGTHTFEEHSNEEMAGGLTPRSVAYNRFNYFRRTAFENDNSNQQINDHVHPTVAEPPVKNEIPNSLFSEKQTANYGAPLTLRVSRTK